ncbi:MAG: pyridoxamine 5'-phosphate oxidase family protein [Desulfosarcina sp.]|nr:pyridoxamine 5'-phosphate oxidase family protein [Desulfobacterales bacterium]
MPVIPDNVLDTLAEPGSVKMVGTVDKDGKPNVVVISTIAVLDPGTIAFADVLLGKTKDNLHKTGKLTVSVLGATGKSYQIKCRFVAFDNKSEMYDRWFEPVWQRMTLQLKGIAIAKVIEVIQD